MERAGRLAAEAIDDTMRSGFSGAPRAAVLCGPGNNGGDGYVIARQLQRRGWDLKVWALGDPSRLSDAARLMRRRWLNSGPCRPVEELSGSDIGEGDVAVDALFGIGLSRAASGGAARALDAAMRRGRIAAVDVLTGVNADTGEFGASGITDPLPAEMTVTFECAKPGHFLGAGGRLTGRLMIAPLGLEAERAALRQSGDLIGMWTQSALPRSLLAKRPDQHKYSHGHVLCVAGPAGRGGAARLAARAALRVGAGLVTIAAPGAAMAEHAAQLNAVMLTAADGPRQLRQKLRDRRINSVCIGPGLGTGGTARGLVLAVLESGRNSVLDADALTAFAGDPETLFAKLSRDAVLTPHGGEFARLFPAESKDIGNPIQRVQAAAQRANAVVLLKGAATVIADPDGRAWMAAATGTDAAPWLATAGSGDVLAGLIAGLMGRGAGAATAAGTAAYLHAAAARSFGPGLIAEDLPELIPGALREGLAGDAAEEPGPSVHEFSTRTL